MKQKMKALDTIDEGDENSEVLPTELENHLPRPIPLYFERLPKRRLEIVGKIHTAFMKRRPFQSRFAIELYFDSDVEIQLLKAWNLLKKCGLNVIKPRPHITLTISPFAHQLKLENILETLALEQEKIPLSFSFGPLRNTLSLKQSNPLIKFHLKLCEAMEKKGIEIGEKYRPGSWVPYCLVAEKVPRSQMGKALLELQSTYHGCGIHIKLVERTPKPEWYCFSEEGATFLFRKVISYSDEMLSQFSVPKEIAKDEAYFPKLAKRGSVDIEVWDPESRIWDMVLRRFFDYTYHIIAVWKRDEGSLKLVAGDVILFYKLKRANVFEFPYHYMIQFERANRELE